MAIIKIKSSQQGQTAAEDAVAVQSEALTAAEFSTEEEMRKQDPAILREEKDRRTVNSKIYRRNNGTAKVICMQYPLHYEKPDGTLEEIDNALIDTGTVYAAQQGKYKIEVAKTSAQEGTVRLSDSDISIEWNYLPPAEAESAAVTLEQATPETTAAQRANAAFSFGSENDTELKYSLFGGNVKENIVIHEKKDTYRFEFGLKTNGVLMQLSEDNTGIIFYKAGSDTKIAEIPSPFMYDATGEVSYEVYYELEEESEGVYRFAVVASESWINDEARIFPVTVDPQIITTDSSYITKQVQYRHTSSGSGGSASGWLSTDNAYIKVFKDRSTEYMTILTIQKSKFEFLDYPITSVNLVLKPYKVEYSGYCYIGGQYVFVSDTEAKSVDITTAFNGSSGDFTLTVEPTVRNIDAEFYFSGTYAPMIEIEYLINGKEKPVVQQFTLAGNLAGQYDIYTGDASIAFEDVSASDSILGVGISHVCKKSADDLHVGKNFRLNLNETLSKTGAAALDADYVYTDASGMKHGFKDTYYYISDEGEKVSIADKTEIAVDLDGKLTYTADNKEYEVKKEQRTQSGLTAITKIEGFKYADYLEQRADEQKQLETQFLSYQSAVDGFVKINKDYPENMQNVNEEDYFNLQEKEVILPKNDALTYVNLRYQFDYYNDYVSNNIVGEAVPKPKISMESSLFEFRLGLNNVQVPEKYTDIENRLTHNEIVAHIKEKLYTSDIEWSFIESIPFEYNFMYKGQQIPASELKSLLRQSNMLTEQSATQETDYDFQWNMLIEQIYKFEKDFANYNLQAQNTFREYKRIGHQLEIYRRQTPVNYLTDGEIVKGFNEEGRLVAIFDNYENILTIEYDESGKIVNVYDGEDKQIAFGYRPDGLLGSITDTRGRRTEYDYDNAGRLTSVLRSNGKGLIFAYDASDNLISVQSLADMLQSVLNYTAENLLYRAMTKSLVAGVAHGIEGEIDSSVNSTVSVTNFSYSDALTTISDDKNNRKIYQFNEGNLYGCYEEEAGKVISAELYEYEAYVKDNVQHAKRETLYKKSYESFSGNDFVGGDYDNCELDEFNNPAKKTTNARPLSAGTTQEGVVTYEYDDNHKCIKETAVVTIKEGTSVSDTYTQVVAYNYNALGKLVRKESYIVGEEDTTGKNIEETEYDAKGNAVRSFSYNSLDSSSKFYTESEVAENGQKLADYDETGENKTEYEYIAGTNVVRTQKFPNGSKFAYGCDESDAVTSISQSTE